MTTLLLLHAFPVDSRMWNPLRAELSDDVELITPDLGGFGTADSVPGSIGFDAVADDLLALLDSRGVERAVVGGCSMGGYAAMALLRKAPERVAGLVLVDTRPDTDDEERRATRLAGADRAEREGTGWLADTVLPGLLASGTPDVRPDLEARLRVVIGEQPPAAVAWALRSMADRPDSTGLLRSFDRPALVVVGERDVLSPPELARDMADVLPAAELVELPGCGHLSPLEAPEELAGTVEDWLRRSEL